jgi:hypothetical protein
MELWGPHRDIGQSVAPKATRSGISDAVAGATTVWRLKLAE